MSEQGTSAVDTAALDAPVSPQSSTKLMLEDAPPADDDTIKLNVGTSEPVSLYDKLGPAIVSSDGVISRIRNWHEMAEDERARVLRVLGKRNKIRLEALRDANGGELPTAEEAKDSTS